MSATTQAARVQVKREGTKVMLTGLDSYPVEARTSTPIATLAVLMNALGESQTYPYLMGVSGQAFRFQLSKGFDGKFDGWCGSSPHANCGHNTLRIAESAIPYDIKGLECFKKSPEEIAAVRRSVVASLDAGIPVISASEESSIIIGYDEGGAILYGVGPFDRPGGKMNPWRGTPWGFIFITPRPERPDRAALIRASIPRALTIAKLTESDVDPAKPNSGYDAGLPALKRWSRELLDDARFTALDEKQLRKVCGFNAWIYEGLVDGRRCAALYLTEIAPEIPAARDQLLQAAALYEKEYKLLNADSCINIAPYPFMLKPGETWTEQQRHKQGELLKEAVAIEEQAIAALEQAAAKLK